MGHRADWAGDADDVLEGSGNQAASMAKFYCCNGLPG
jgi:hypothetical protein